MSNGSANPSSRLQRFGRFPLTRLVIGFLMIFIPLAVGQLFIASQPFSRLFRNLLLTAFTVSVAYGAYYALVHFIELRQLSELGAAGAVRETVQGIVLGMLLLVGTIAILALAGAYRLLGANSWIVVLAPLFAAVTSAFGEEILFRGVLFRIVEQSLGSWLALALSAAIFGGLHLLNEHATIVGALAVMLAGIVLGGAYMLTRRLWLPIGIHFAVNFAQSGIFGTAVSGNGARTGLLQSSLTGPDWLTGGEFGVEASLIVVVLCIVVGGLLLWRANQKGNLLQPSWSHRATPQKSV